MDKGAVPATSQIEVPASKFVHPGTGGVMPRAGNPRHRPQHVEEVSGVTAVSLGSMAGDTHA